MQYLPLYRVVSPDIALAMSAMVIPSLSILATLALTAGTDVGVPVGMEEGINVGDTVGLEVGSDYIQSKHLHNIYCIN